MWSHAVKRLWSERDKRQKKGDGKRKQDNNFRLLGSQEGECQEVFQELGACQEVFQELGVCQEGFPGAGGMPGGMPGGAGWGVPGGMPGAGGMGGAHGVDLSSVLKDPELMQMFQVERYMYVCVYVLYMCMGVALSLIHI